MSDERVVLTAELRDEMSAPLTNLQANVRSTERAITGAASRQSTATRNSSRTIMSALDDQGTSTRGLQGVWNRLTSTASTAWNGARSSITTAVSGMTTGTRLLGTEAVSASNRLRDANGRFVAAGRTVGENTGQALSGGFSSKIKGLFAGAAAALGAQQIAAGMNSAVNAFSDLEDSSAAAGTIYKENMSGIIAMSKTAGEALGMNEAQVVTAAQTYGVYGQSAGLAGKELETFSSDLITRAGDMASFFGKSPEQAIEAIGAAMRGEAEPIRSFGVMLDDATMRQKALEMGLISTTKDALEPQTKILAAQALIMEKSSGVAGDFANTMNSTANVQKRLQAATTNLSAKIGGLLAPMFTSARLKALGAVNGMSAFLDKVKVAQGLLASGATTGDIAAALGFGPRTTAIISETMGSWLAFKGGISEGGEVTSSGVAGFFERVGIAIFNLKTMVAGFGPAQWMGVAGGAGLLLASFGKLAPMFAPLMGMFARFGPLLTQAGGALKFLLGPIGLISALFIYAYSTSEPFRNAVNMLVGTVLTLGMTLLTSLMPILTTLMTSILPLITSLFSMLVPVFTSILLAIIPIVTTMITQLVPIFMQLITAVLPIVMSLLTQLAPIFMQLLTALLPIIPPVMEIVSLLLNLAMQVITPLLPLIVMLAGIFGSVLGGAINLLMPIVKFLIEAFVNLVTFLKGPLSEAIRFVGGLFEGIGKMIGDVAKNVGDFMSNPMGGIQDMLGIPKNSGGGVYSGGGVVQQFAGGGVLGGYSPGVDSIPALLSPGESVLVPELTRALGPTNIMAANRIASSGRAAGSGPALSGGFSRTSGGGGGGSTTVVAAGAVQITIVAQDGRITDADIDTIKEVIEGIFDDAESRSY